VPAHAAHENVLRDLGRNHKPDFDRKLEFESRGQVKLEHSGHFSFSFVTLVFFVRDLVVDIIETIPDPLHELIREAGASFAGVDDFYLDGRLAFEAYLFPVVSTRLPDSRDLGRDFGRDFFIRWFGFRFGHVRLTKSVMSSRISANRSRQVMSFQHGIVNMMM